MRSSAFLFVIAAVSQQTFAAAAPALPEAHIIQQLGKRADFTPSCEQFGIINYVLSAKCKNKQGKLGSFVKLDLNKYISNQAGNLAVGFR